MHCLLSSTLLLHSVQHLCVRQFVMTKCTMYIGLVYTNSQEECKLTYYIRLCIDEVNGGMPATDGHIIWYQNITVTTTNNRLATNQQMECRLYANTPQAISNTRVFCCGKCRHPKWPIVYQSGSMAVYSCR